MIPNLHLGFVQGKEDRVAVYVYNVHLDHKSQKSRQKSIEMFLERIMNRKYKFPVLVTGDLMNEKSADPLFKRSDPAMRVRCVFPMRDFPTSFESFRWHLTFSGISVWSQN